MMKNGLAYFCLMALLLFFSCTREEFESGSGWTVDIRFSTSELAITRATTPGDGQSADGGGFTDYYMSFRAPSAGTLKIWASSTDASTQKLCILEGGVITTENCTGTSKPADGDAFNIPVSGEGQVTVFPSDGVSRIYKLTYRCTISGRDSTLVWDFGDDDFQALVSTSGAPTILPPATTAPSLSSQPSVWMLILNGLTIWSKTESTWSTAGGYFEWGGYYNSSTAAAPVDLVILIADNKAGSATFGNIVATYPSGGAAVSGTLKSQSVKDAVVTFNFSGLDYGSADSWDYTVYAFGNTAGLWDMQSVDAGDPATVINVNGKAGLLSLTKSFQLDSLRFKAQDRHTRNWEPAYASDDTDGNGVSDAYEALYPTKRDTMFNDGVKLLSGARLPVSAKTSMKVTSGKNGEAYLELLRCVAKVTARIVNNTGEELKLFEYKHTLHNINPDRGWVLPHDNDVLGGPANLMANPCAKYGNLDVAVPISKNGSRDYDWYVFPSQGPFNVCIQFTLNKDNPLLDNATYTYNKLPITDWKAVNIPALGRNQHLIVTTRISRGLTVSFNFEVASWTDNTASVHFD